MINEKEKNKILLKTQQLLISQKHNVFTEEIIKTDLSSNGAKTKESIDSTEMQMGRVKVQYVKKKKLNLKM